MGDAKRNPRSQQYTGPLPDWLIQPMLGHRLVPNAAWMEANKAALEAGEQVPAAPEDMDIEFMLCAGMAYPSRLLGQENWPHAVNDVTVLARVPFKSFKAEIDAKIAGPVTTAGTPPEPPANAEQDPSLS